MHTACRCCGSNRTALVGPIPPSAIFAGRQLSRFLPGGSLCACAHCDLRFRHPAPSKETLDALYKNGSPVNWQEIVADRIDWRLASTFLSGQPNVKSVLDIGCFDGRFLASLGDKYQKLGIEIHQEAGLRAAAQGVHLVAHDLSMLPRSNVKANAVTAIDVIEHTLNPLDFLACMRDAATPGGFLLITTGNTSAWSWRLMGSRYWYCSIGEHMSFISPAWCNFASRRLGLEVIEIKRFSHKGPNVSTRIRIREIIKNLTYSTSPYLTAMVRRSRVKPDAPQDPPELLFAPPDWMSAKDHIFVAFKKPS